MSSSKDKDTDLTGTVTTELKKIPDYGSLSGSNKNKAQIPKGIDLTTTTTNNVSLRVGPTSIGNKAKGIIKKNTKIRICLMNFGNLKGGKFGVWANITSPNETCSNGDKNATYTTVE